MATRPIRVWNGSEWEDVAIAPYDSGEFLTTSAASATYLRQDSASAAYIPDSIVDAKGDLIVASADNILDNLAVGSDGQILSADSNESLGMKWIDAGGGKILQVVRTTSSAAFSTSSQTFVDVTNMSVTITPQKSDSSVLVIASVCLELTRTTDTQNHAYLRICDSSNNALSGAEDANLGLINESSQFIRMRSMQTVIGYVQPGTTSSVSYKLQFRSYSSGNTVYIRNDTNNGVTGQLYAIEVAS